MMFANFTLTKGKRPSPDLRVENGLHLLMVENAKSHDKTACMKNENKM